MMAVTRGPVGQSEKNRRLALRVPAYTIHRKKRDTSVHAVYSLSKARASGELAVIQPQQGRFLRLLWGRQIVVSTRCHFMNRFCLNMYAKIRSAR